MTLCHSRRGYTRGTVFRRSRQNQSAQQERSNAPASAEALDITRALPELLSRPSLEGVFENALALASQLLGGNINGFAVLLRGQDRVVSVFQYPRSLVGLNLSGPWAAMRPRLLPDGSRELYEANSASAQQKFDEAGMRDVPLSLIIPVTDRGRAVGVLVLDRSNAESISPAQQEELTRFGAAVGPLIGLYESREEWQQIARKITGAAVEAIESRDFDALGHAGAVAEASLKIGRALGFNGRELEELWFAATLHDVGKIHGEQGHALVSANFLHNVPHLAEARKAIRHHHERWDGQGEPDHLAGEDIPLYARILAVANAYVKSGDLTQVANLANKQLDPKLIAALEKALS